MLLLTISIWQGVVWIQNYAISWIYPDSYGSWQFYLVPGGYFRVPEGYIETVPNTYIRFLKVTSLTNRHCHHAHVCSAGAQGERTWHGRNIRPLLCHLTMPSMPSHCIALHTLCTFKHIKRQNWYNSNIQTPGSKFNHYHVGSCFCTCRNLCPKYNFEDC